MTLIQRVAQRWRDWRLEREISAVQKKINWLMENDPSNKSNCFDHYYTVSCFCAERMGLENKRSPSQLARMAKGQG